MARFIMVGRLQASLFVGIVTLLSLILPVGILANGAISLVTLRHGWRQGLYLGFIAAAVLAVAMTVISSAPMSGFLTGLVHTLPIVAASAVLLQTVSWQRTFELLVLIAIFIAVIFHTVVGDLTIFWAELFSAFKPVISAGWPEGRWDEWVLQMAPRMTGLVAFLYVMAFVMTLFIGRYWQAKLYNAGGFASEFRQLRLGINMSIAAMVLLILATIIGGSLFNTFAVIIMTVFLFQGLSVAHCLVKHTNMHVGWLVGMYVFLFLLPLQVGVMFSVFGVVDNFIDTRKKLMKQ